MGKLTLDEVREQIHNNDPAIEANQIWEAKDEKGKILRRIRILALHPDPVKQNGDKQWIYQEIPGQMVKHPYLGVCPEFNLRVIFRLEQ